MEGIIPREHRQDHLSGFACFHPIDHLANRQTEIKVLAKLALDVFQQRELPLHSSIGMQARTRGPQSTMAWASIVISCLSKFLGGLGTADCLGRIYELHAHHIFLHIIAINGLHANKSRLSGIRRLFVLGCFIDGHHAKIADYLIHPVVAGRGHHEVLYPPMRW